MFCLVPKNWDFKTQISTETWVSHFSGKGIPALQRAAVSTSNCPQSISPGRDALELRFGAELRLTCHQLRKNRAFARIQRRDVQRNCWTKLSRVENPKSGTKQSEDLHRFCWLHFCKEVLGSLLKVCHRTLMPEVARD